MPLPRTRISLIPSVFQRKIVSPCQLFQRTASLGIWIQKEHLYFRIKWRQLKNTGHMMRKRGGGLVNLKLAVHIEGNRYCEQVRHLSEELAQIVNGRTTCEKNSKKSLFRATKIECRRKKLNFHLFLKAFMW